MCLCLEALAPHKEAARRACAFCDEVLRIGGRLGRSVKKVLDAPDRLMAACARRGFGAGQPEMRLIW